MLMKPEFGHSYTKEDCYGSVGEGWHSLIDKMFEAIDKTPMPLYIVDCKEKWGGLRVYWDASNEHQDLFTEEDFKGFEDFIYELENESFGICEACGQDGMPRDRGWIKTMCETCYNEGL